MEISKVRKRILGVGILLMLAALALATAGMAASDQWKPDGTYSLVIEKKFDEGMDPAVLAEAQGKTYRFYIKGYRLDSGRNEHPIDQIVTIDANSDWKSQEFHSDGPIHVSVTEITNDITLKVTQDGKVTEYNMGDSRAETKTLFDESPKVRELNNNGRIVLSRPKTKLVSDGNGGTREETVTTISNFRITSKWTASEYAKPEGWQPYNNVVTLVPGNDPIVLDNLSAGEYTIEDLSVSGYTVKLGKRGEDVGKEETPAPGGEPSAAVYSARAGETEGKQTQGAFYINSYPGKLTITAGGEAGDGRMHYFTVKRVEAPNGARPFVDRTTDAVASQGTYTLDDLPRGGYEVTEQTFTEAPTGFKVKVPQMKDEEKSLEFRNYTAAGETITRYFVTMGGDYVDGFRYGPIYDKNGKMLPETEKYNVRYIATWLQEDGSTERKGYSAADRKGTYYYTLKNTIIPGTGSQRLAFGIGETAANKGGYCLLKWNEHTRVEKNLTASKANTNYSVTIDDRGWMEITAPKVDDPNNTVKYIYTLRKKAGGEALRTETLRPEGTTKFTGLEKGTYLLTETLSFADPVGFHMEVSGGPFGSTTAGEDTEIRVMEPRELIIEKPKGKEGDSRNYTFVIERTDSGAKAARSVMAASEGGELTIKAATGKNDEFTEKYDGTVTFPLKVVLQAGQTSLAITLPKGTYTVTPVDDLTEVFEMRCTDTSQVHAEVAGANSVTFTNVFTKGTLGYRYVHEYYIKDPETNTYTYEGNSPITTVGGRSNPNEFYNSVDITKEPVFTYRFEGKEETFHYDYMPENNGYGRVVESAEVDSTASNGLRLRNRAYEKDDSAGRKEIRYQVDNDLTAKKTIGVDKEKTQVIILRYFRVLPEAQKGSYNYIHIYYRRDENGTHWEGTSNLTNLPGQLNVPHDESKVPVEPKFTAQDGPDVGKEFTYIYDKSPSYGTLTNDHKAPHIEQQVISGFNDTENGKLHYHYIPNSNANYVIPTAEGNQVIILRYYRTPSQDGTYNIVHEYYFQEKNLNQGGTGDAEDTDDNRDPSQGGETGGGDPKPPVPVDPEPNNPTDEAGTAEPPVTDEPAAPPAPADPLAGDDSTEPPAPADPLAGDDSTEPPAPADSPANDGSTEPPAPADPPANDGSTEPPAPADPLAGDDSTEPPAPADPLASDDSTEPAAPADPLASDDSTAPSTPADPPANDGSTEPPAPADPPANDDSTEPAAPADPPANDDSTEPPAPVDPPVINDSVEDPEGNVSLLADEEDAPPSEDSSGVAGGTLSSDEEHIYTFEGARKIETRTDKLGSTHKGEEKDHLPTWTPEGMDEQKTYAYHDVVYGIAGEDGTYKPVTNMEWASVTEEGNQIIILRYIRGDGVTPDPEEPDPEEPDPPTPTDPPGGDEDPKPPTKDPEDPKDPTKDPEDPKDPENPPVDPENPPVDPENPPVDPENPPVDPENPPVNPEYPTELPDPNDPDSPEVITILEDGVPKTYVKVWDPNNDEWVYIPEEDVPLWNIVPRTGDSLSLWMALAGASLCGLAILIPAPKKRKNR